jgi:hypothetical protein
MAWKDEALRKVAEKKAVERPQFTLPIDWKQEWRLELAWFRRVISQCRDAELKREMQALTAVVPESESDWLVLGKRMQGLWWEARNGQTAS